MFLNEMFNQVLSFSGFTTQKEKMEELQNQKTYSIIRTEFIDLGKATNGMIYIGATYNRAYDLFDYVGIFYSFSEAKRICGEHSEVLTYSIN